MSDDPELDTSWERSKVQHESKEDLIECGSENNQVPRKAEWDARTSITTQNLFENQ